MTQELIRAFPAQPTTPTTPAPAPAPAAPEFPVADDAYVTGRDIREALNRQLQAMQPVGTATIEMAAQSVYASAKIHPQYADVFKRYEPEIQQALARIPKHLWNLDTMETVTTFVRGKHYAELAREEAQRLAAQMEPAMRSTGAAGPVPTPPTNPASLDGAKLPEEWRARAKRVGLTYRAVQEFCFQNGMSPEQFFKQFEREVVTDAVVESRNPHFAA